eukprot:6991723-Pyramimonas_sp.AAC.1
MRPRSRARIQTAPIQDARAAFRKFVLVWWVQLLSDALVHQPEHIQPFPVAGFTQSRGRSPGCS